MFKLKQQLLSLFVVIASLCSCSKSEPIKPLPPIPNGGGGTGVSYAIADYFTPYDMEADDNVEGEIPDGTARFDTLSHSGYIIRGGVSYITLTSFRYYDYLRVGVDGVDGHYLLKSGDFEREYLPSGDYEYRFKLLVDDGFESSKVSLCVAGCEYRDEITTKVKSVMEVASPVGCQDGLQINLSYDNNKDIDLHLFLPKGVNIGSGSEIYYGNPGVMSSDGKVLCGLDLTSNDDIYPDGILSENIYISKEYLAAGEYVVCINMYGNLDPNIDTNYVVRLNGGGQNVEIISGVTPSVGSFAVGAPSNMWDTSKYLEVMRFRVVETPSQAVATRSAQDVVAIPLSSEAIRKINQFK